MQRYHGDEITRPSGRAAFPVSKIAQLSSMLGDILAVIGSWIQFLVQPQQDVPLHCSVSDVEALAATVHPSPLTVINLNLWHDWPRHRRLPERLESIARHIEEQGAQIVLLQESLRTPELEAHRWLAERLGMQAIYHRANGHQEGIGFEEGLAVLSSLPLGEVRHQTLEPSIEPFVRRVALGVEIKVGRSSFWAVSTHLGLLRARNAAQLRHLRDWVTEVTSGRPALIGGDFNADESTSQIQQISRDWVDTFRALHPTKEGFSHVLHWPWGTKMCAHRLDYLFLKPSSVPWRILEAGYLDHIHAPYSDHKAVLTRFDSCHLN
jgi:endonuclease/exonuclease/phosphatase family metal-dependent hydrolase